MISALLAALLTQSTLSASAAPEGAPYSTGSAAAGYRVGPGSVIESSSYNVAPRVNLARTGVSIDAYDQRIESRWGADDPFYTGTVRGGAALAQSRQGPLDGGWTVASADGSPLYVLQLVDVGEGWLEGAWRQDGVGAEGRPRASGFIPLISREAGRVVLRFLEPGADAPTAVTLEMAGDGSWSGQAARGDGSSTAVRMLPR